MKTPPKPSVHVILVTGGLILAAVAAIALPALGKGPSLPPVPASFTPGPPAGEAFFTPAPNPTPSIYVPVYPSPKPIPRPEPVASSAPMPEWIPLEQPPVERTQEAPSLEGRLAGIDISHWQGEVHWNELAESRISFVYTKATEGKGFIDGTYAENHRAAHATGVAFGAYDYASATPQVTDAIRDADHFLKIAKLGPNDLIPVLDLEETGGTTNAQLARWVRAWCDRIYERLGVRPMIYTSPTFWRGPMRDEIEYALEGHRLWLAHWRVTAPSVPAEMWGNKDWTLWQWTSWGSVPGVTGRVDMNVYNGTDLTPLTIAGAQNAGS